MNHMIHVREDHNLYSYVKYLIWLEKKSQKDCDVLDLQVIEKYQNKDISWFPIGRSIWYEMKSNDKADVNERIIEQRSFENLRELNAEDDVSVMDESVGDKEKGSN